VRDLEALDAWIAKARAAGVVAFDTETDALSSANAGSARLAGGGGGRGLLHPPGPRGEGGLAFDAPADITQIPLDEAIARLKPLLEDPTVLKVAQNAKYDLAVSRATVSRSPRSTTPC